MSGPLELYRTTVNVRGLGAGTQIEIDPTDEGWAGDISSRRIVPVRVVDPAPVEVAPGVTIQAESYYEGRRGVSETYVTDDDDPVSDLDDGPAPNEWAEDWDSGAIVDLRTAGQIDRDLMARDD